MITALVTFELTAPMTVDKAKELFLTSAPNYLNYKGLVRKYYLLTENGKTAGGVYLWDSKKDAEAMYTPAWEKFIREKYGVGPSITDFSSPVIVDNLSGEIRSF